MDAHDIRQVHLLGISMGSRIALVVAAKNPERVKSLILKVDAARSPSTDDPQAARAYERLWTAMTEPEILKAMAPYPPTVASFLRLFEALKEFDGSDLLKKITAPTLIVNGTKDPSTPVQCAEELFQGITGAKMILVEEDHMFSRTKPDLLLTPVLEFLAVVDGRSLV
ncbi:alpha/beta fold hydrolase [Methanosphaerula palustris]|uniref:alpha/beta fold hydrolase n=1 Tax=Methanosphaerula palustris TaxID=475088 RepID=UPI000321D32D|nr:alpha/beta hydrolase [Methanosphaerula palustris]